MRKKLEGNGLWESSRMMLPEHKERYVVHQQRLPAKIRPQLDEQEAERLSRLIAESMQTGRMITLHLFQEIGESASRGIITKIDQQNKALRLAGSNDYSWIKLNDIIDAEL